MDYPKVDGDTSIFDVLVTSTVQYRSLTRLLPDDRLCFFADSCEILPPLSQVFLLVSAKYDGPGGPTRDSLCVKEDLHQYAPMIC